MDHLSKGRRLAVIIGLCLQSFLVMFSYALSRPATESLFLKSQGSDNLPLAWLAVALGSIVMVIVYNRVLPKADLVKMFGQVCLLCSLLLAALIHCCQYWPDWAYYVLYAWKDLYVVALVEVFYTYTNTVLSVEKASWIYGFFGAIGSIGGLIGNLAVGSIAQTWGSEIALKIVVGMLLVMAILGRVIAFIHGPVTRHASPAPEEKNDKTSAVAATSSSAWAKFLDRPFFKACKIVNKSYYLWLMVILICLVQVAMTLIDFEYNDILFKTYADVDRRTAVIGRVYAIVSATTLLFNVLTGPTIKLLGVTGTMIGIPTLLAAGMTVFLCCPVFLVIAGVKVTSKVMDYSLFKAVRQLLYIPLNYEEKTAGKSIVDMMVFRLAKGGAALIMMGITAIKAGNFVAPLVIVILAGWGWLATIIAQRFKKVETETKQRESNRPVSINQA